MKKILILSYLFAPQNTVGAIRPTKLGKFLSEKKYIVDVITFNAGIEDKTFQKELSLINQVYLVGKSLILKKIELIFIKTKKNLEATPDLNMKEEKKISKKIVRKKNIYMKQYLRGFIYSLDFFIMFILFSFRKKKYSQYEVLITSSGPVASILCGLWIKKNNPEIKWICDFRDPLVVDFTPVIFKSLYNYIQNLACKKADSIVAVSEGYLERICSGKYTEKSYVITNGYDKADLETIINKQDNLKNLNDNEKFSFVYPGSLYGGKRKMSVLFKVLKELLDEKKITLEKIEFRYAGDEIQELINQALPYNLDTILVNYGSLNRKDCLKLQNESRYLLLSTWNSSGEEGVLPGKILEYMLFNKPIIGIITGNKADSEVKRIINKTNIGIVYEEADRQSFKILKDYLAKEYERFLSNQQSYFNPNKSEMKKYDFSHISEKFIEIIEKNQ